jgi:hypothetical protein
MTTNDKNQQTPGATPSPGQPVAGSPADLDKRAENENPRANENIPREDNENGDTTSDVGSEITDGEDA